MTILEAIKTVLSKKKDGLTCKEITNHILSEKLYTFNTADPNSIVGHSLRRHCQGLEFPSAHPVKHFYGNTAQKSRRDTARSDIIRPWINR